MGGSAAGDERDGVYNNTISQANERLLASTLTGDVRNLKTLQKCSSGGTKVDQCVW